MVARAGEDEIIARWFAPLAGAGGLGLRDDAALVAPRPGHAIVVSKDMLVAGRHFFADDPPAAIARKALRVNLSDLAAKAAEPVGFLLGLALHEGWSEAWLSGFADGLGSDAALFACPLLGGDTVATTGPLILSITVFGTVADGRMVPRTGTTEGDRLYVTGSIGDAALGLRLRTGEGAWIGSLAEADRQALQERYLHPQPRLAMRAALRDHARAAMDVSDGLAGDLTKMLALEGLGARIALGAVPLSPAARNALALNPTLRDTILSGGDDYEILCAVPPAGADAFERAAAAAGVPVSLLGEAEGGEKAVVFLDEAGDAIPLTRASFQHFD